MYEPLPDTESIRLVELLPAGKDDIIRIKLFTALLRDRLSYEALSYELGLPISNQRKICHYYQTPTSDEDPMRRPANDGYE